MPFATLRDRLPEWTVAIADLPDNLMGYADPDQRIIWISNRLDRNQRRCTLMHEIIHAERGDSHDDPVAEALVRLETARRLISIDALAAVFTWASHPDDICEALEVDHGVLRTRLRNLSKDEVSRLRRVLVRTVSLGPDPDQISGMCLLHQWWIRHRQPDPAPQHINCVLNRTTHTTGDTYGTRHRIRHAQPGQEGPGRNEPAARADAGRAAAHQLTA